MLRASAATFSYPLDIEAVRDPSIPSGVPGGNLLLRFVDALLVGTEPVDDIRTLIVDDLGPEALVDAASVFGNFSMMNRIAEGSGIPVAAAAVERERALIDSLGLADFVKH